jgi:glycolate oxidase subunit GlcD
VCRGCGGRPRIQLSVPGTSGIASALGGIVGERFVLSSNFEQYLRDETETRGIRGRADAVVLPADAAEVAAVVAWCYENDIDVTPRGGGTGYAGGAVPLGGVVLSLERLGKVRAFDPLVWRIQVEAGVRTATLHQLARESGLWFPPDPGAAETSQVGGNIATNAGGPHAFKYGVTGAWVLGLEVVVPPGELITIGGPVRKDVAGYDLKSLLVGSEGTLGIITAAWIRLIPAPECALPLIGIYADRDTGVAAIEAMLGNGIPAAALEYLDGKSLAASAATFPFELPADSGFAVIAEVDGSVAEVARLADEVQDVLAESALVVHRVAHRDEIARLWGWRDGVSVGVTSIRGWKVSEDIAVPLDRLRDALAGADAIAERHGLECCSWGHAGDGNLHITFLVDQADETELMLADDAASDLFALAVELGGSISGEHGLGTVKRGGLARQWTDPAVALHEAVKRVFDPKNLLNPGKKLAR